MKPKLFVGRIACTLAFIIGIGGQQHQAIAAAQSNPAALKTISSDLFSGYQEESGAITITRKGDLVDPYFAMKALWVLGYGKTTPPEPKEQEAALRLMSWMLQFQLPNGSFERYCKASDQSAGILWKKCKPADADDLMTALWVYCVLRYAPNDTTWNNSAARALTLLGSLWDEKRQVFRLFPNNEEALFIDNLELLELLPAIGNSAALTRLFPNATEASKSPTVSLFQNGITNKLKTGIEKTFEIKLTTQTYAGRLASPGQLPGVNFYPHLVAPIYIWTAGVQSKATAQRLWAQWWELAGNAWLKRETDNYPWALIALVAYRLDPAALKLWLAASCKQRTESVWTVMDEAVWLRLGNTAQCSAGGAK